MTILRKKTSKIIYIYISINIFEHRPPRARPAAAGVFRTPGPGYICSDHQIPALSQFSASSTHFLASSPISGVHFSASSAHFLVASSLS